MEEQVSATTDDQEQGPSVQDVVAKSHFDEPRWIMEHAIRWIALRSLKAFTSRDLDEIRELRCRAILHGSNNGLVSKNPAAELIDALRAGKIKAIGSDHKELSPSSCDSALSHDLRTWPPTRFAREEMLAQFSSAGPMLAKTQSPRTAINKQKRQATISAIEEIGVKALAIMPQKIREEEVIEHVKARYSGLTVSDRHVRKIFCELVKGKD